MKINTPIILLASLIPLLGAAEISAENSGEPITFACTMGGPSLDSVREGQCQIYGNMSMERQAAVLPPKFERNKHLVFNSFALARTFEGGNGKGGVVVQACKVEYALPDRPVPCKRSALAVAPYSANQSAYVAVQAQIKVAKRKIAGRVLGGHSEYVLDVVADPNSANEVGTAVCSHLGYRWSPAEGSRIELLMSNAIAQERHWEVGEGNRKATGYYQAYTYLYPDMVEGNSGLLISASKDTPWDPNHTQTPECYYQHGKWNRNENSFYSRLSDLTLITLTGTGDILPGITQSFTSAQRLLFYRDEKECGQPMLKDKSTRLMPVSKVVCME